MNNLREDIIALFADFDGRDRYAERIESWSHHQRQARRDYHRDYAAKRYQFDADFRSRHKAAVERYRDRQLGADRKRRTFGPLPIVHGTYAAYAKRKCRCTDCRRASAAYRKSLRQRRSMEVTLQGGLTP